MFNLETVITWKTCLSGMGGSPMKRSNGTDGSRTKRLSGMAGRKMRRSNGMDGVLILLTSGLLHGNDLAMGHDGDKSRSDMVDSELESSIAVGAGVCTYLSLTFV